MANVKQTVSIDGAIQNLRKFAENLAYLLKTRIQDRTPVDTGLLKSAWTKKVTDGGRHIEIDNQTPYAGYIEYGTPRINPPFAMVRTTLAEIDTLVAQALAGNTKADHVGLTRAPGQKHG